MNYYTYRIPHQSRLGCLNSTETQDSIRSRFKFGEYGLTPVSSRRYWAILRDNYKYG